MSASLSGNRRRTCDPAGRRRGRAAVCLVLMAAALRSCTTPPMKVAPPTALPEAFPSGGEAAAPAKWWTAFGDARLNRLVERALRDNFSLRVAWDRLDQARALADRSEAPLWPSLDARAGASRTWRKPGGAGGTAASDFSLGLAAGYEVDLWGRVRSARDAARLDARAGDEDLHAAAITLAAEVALTWYELIERRGQIRLLDQQIQTNNDYLEIITLKFRRGQASATDVLQQRQLVESTKGERVRVASAIEVLRHRLAVLVGRAPGEAGEQPPDELPGMPPLPRTGVPAVWVRRRPDVRAARLRVRAADRRVAAAIADQFPTLGVSVGAETSAQQIRDLFDNWLANIAANVAAPLFDAGLRRAEVRRARAVVSQRLNEYGQVVLTALREVADAVAREAKQAEYLASLRRQLELSAKSTEQTRENYTKGTMDFTRYLTTLLAHQRLQRTYLQARRELVGFRINLYRALGGSWPLPSPPRAGAGGDPPGAQDRNRKGNDDANQ